RDTLICYSYSKSFSLPGERIGYVCVPSCVTDADMVYAAVAGAARRYGYVCAPSLLQEVVARCADVLPDLTVYRRNRDLLYNSLTEMGYDCVRPDGAFYLLVRAPENDGAAFSERAKGKNVLVVPGGGFGAPHHVRIAYCVETDMIERSLNVFRALR
ncbi:MAG: aminotransferase class I/II-fold pyridoxal phosphate-dependent enzyme, partial [Clostridia bacterium]|nr:aminotransferase class I/II-fold pyridoxal phosphate-dependent enzyme [Clostridia bacterium]